MRVEGTTVYFDQPGHENTAETLRVARARAEQGGIRDIVVASSTGATGIKACELFPGYNVVVVAGAVGYPDPNARRMPPAHRATLEAHGATVCFAWHAFGRLGRAVHRTFGAMQLDEVIAHALRVVGAGVKVACEVVCMATDAGLIRAGQDVITRWIVGPHPGAPPILFGGVHFPVYQTHLPQPWACLSPPYRARSGSWADNRS
ncbi:MAG TPA: hypothetical protein VF579_10640 [Candidatus Methylomirabilis sp.]